MRKSIQIFVLIATIVISCKKKQSELTENQGVISPQIQTSAPTPTIANSFYGIFLTTFSTIRTADSNVVSNDSRVYFSGQSVTELGINPVSVNSVYLNGDSLNFQFSEKYYSSNSENGPLSVQSWSINGANGIPSFTYNNPNPAPSYSGFEVLADSANKSLGLTMSLNNVNDFVSGSITLSGNGQQLTKSFNNVNNTIIFNSSELNKLPTGPYVILNVTITNSSAINVSGKNFQLTKILAYRKFINLKD